MKSIKLFEKTYTIDGKEFFDYGTEDVNSNDLFDTHKTGMSFYDDLLNNPEYMRKNKNLTSKIVYMTPREYFEECGKIFGNNSSKQIEQTKRDTSTIEFLKDVIQTAKKKFPLPFLDYANAGQEGRHRMYTAAELTSWDTKFPVLIVDYYDKELQKKIEANRNKNRLDRLVNQAVRNALQYSYKDVQEFETEVEYQLSDIFEKDIQPEITKDNDILTISAEGGDTEIDINEIKIKETDDYEEEEIDIDDLDNIDDWLEQHNIEL